MIDFLTMLYGTVEPMDAALARHRSIAKAIDILWRDTVHMERELRAEEGRVALALCQIEHRVLAPTDTERG